MRNNSADQSLRARARTVIPNGMYGHQSVALLPEGYPQFFSRAKGAYLWDADGNQYIDYLCGYGPNLFGYGHEQINAAFLNQLQSGDAMTGPGPAMVEAAEVLVGQIKHADWVMFCKNGTDATTMALMIARHHTKKSTILRAKGAYHGAAPWCTPVANGTTAADHANQIFYDYNDPESLEAAVKQAGGDLAAIFAAPIKHDTFVDQAPLDAEYARKARALADERGALLVVDDVRGGFRLARDCSWSLVGVEPDLSAWGKAIANGHPLSALAGSEPFRAAAGSIYVTGSYWFAAAPMAAAVATLGLIRDSDYLERTVALGDRLRKGLDEAATQYGFKLRQTGPSQMPLIMVDDDPGFGKTYFWTAALNQRGVYVHPWHNMFICAALTDADIDNTIDRAADAFALMQRAGPIEPAAPLKAFRNRGAARE
jgi:glutamate-1-semialdehyde 2,1-aminomutase